MTTDGGTNESGTIFRINSDGSGFAVLASLPTNSWTIPVENFPFATSLKSPPVGGLSVAADRIFGTTHGGGANAAGTIFSVSMSGGDFRILKDFAPLEGTAPCGDLVIADGVLYGTTSSGGAKKLGTIFRINSDGTGFASLMHFQTRSITGAVPLGGLVLNNGKLYGTTSEGGADFFGGTLFSIKTDGSDFQVLKTFVPSESNGTAPAGRLAFDNECLFGVTTKSGQSFSSFSSVYRLSLAD